MDEGSSYKEAVTLGLAKGYLKIDGPPVVNEGGITGNELIFRSGSLTREVADSALTIHDRLVGEGCLASDEPLRRHILIVVEKTA